ncbi:hypothetical protein MLD38_006562 [Melastoma candidum]|uniref:Uncharacterized protein n=1 Tax=Melastoma candidum TaxID=119954 RepID=A0ACB9RNE2_9MYRT|nr:hypothetical protein MLD38_006562 [Melastoma candidum]
MGYGVGIPPPKWVMPVAILLSLALSVTSSVTYDGKAIIVDGQRRILFSGSIHYPRSTPEMWPNLFREAKDGGLDVIQTYVFWNGHEPSRGEYNFEGRFDLVRFVKLAQVAGLYVHLRIGPYVCAEWNFGGFPVWLKYVPGMVFRTDNEPFKAEMRRFTEKIVGLMKSENLFQPQGGPIILSQIENEFELVEYYTGEVGKAYAMWAAEMAVGLDTGVPWVMCKQADAPDPIINTCNGFYCEGFEPNQKYKPKIWTEAWTGWFTGYGQAVPHRPVEDLAYAVMRFVQNRGSYVNYYMYHGGTNFGRTSSGRFIATSYDYDAPIDEYGLLRELKWGHLRDLHMAVKLCEPALVSSDPTVTQLGDHQEAHVYESGSGDCAAFLANYDPQNDANVTFRGSQYHLLPWSVSVLPDCKTVVFNTAQVGAQSSLTRMTPVMSIPLLWESYSEEYTSADDDDVTVMSGLLEQINITRDDSDYLWYMMELKIDPDEEFLKTGRFPQLTIWSAGHALHVIINGQLSGTVYGGLDDPRLTFSDTIRLRAGTNKLSLLSVSVGLPNVGLHFETWNAGVLGPITLHGLNSGTWNLTSQNWSYKIGLKGEGLGLHTVSGSSSVEWMGGQSLVLKQPLTWYKAKFDAPEGNGPLALDMIGMGKGQIWVNGQGIGRHWPGYTAQGNCNKCTYAGLFDEGKCRTDCGEPSQRWYHIPRSWLNPEDNLLVVLEEWGGDPQGISLVEREVASVCSEIFDGQPPLHKHSLPKAHLRCPSGQFISDIKFASYGTPQGSCGNYAEGSCHARRSYDALRKNCLGNQNCSVAVGPKVFGGDPCPNTPKKLSVEAICGRLPPTPSHRGHTII